MKLNNVVPDGHTDSRTHIVTHKKHKTEETEHRTHVLHMCNIYVSDDTRFLKSSGKCENFF